MVYVLVMLVFYSGKPDIERLTVIHPNKGLCEAHVEGIQAKAERDLMALKASGVEEIVLNCIPMKEA